MRKGVSLIKAKVKILMLSLVLAIIAATLFATPIQADPYVIGLNNPVLSPVTVYTAPTHDPVDLVLNGQAVGHFFTGTGQRPLKK